MGGSGEKMDGWWQETRKVEDYHEVPVHQTGCCC